MLPPPFRAAPANRERLAAFIRPRSRHYWRLQELPGDIHRDEHGGSPLSESAPIYAGPALRGSRSLFLDVSTSGNLLLSGVPSEISYLGGTGPWTRGCLVRILSTPSQAMMLWQYAAGTGWSLCYLQTNAPGGGFLMQRNDGTNPADSTPTPLAPPSPGLHLVVGTYDGATMRLYVDGAQVAERASTVSIDTASKLLRWGGNGGTTSIHAYLSECFTQDQAWTPAEVRAAAAIALGG